MNIFVGNLPFAANESDVKKLFEDFGDVVSVAIVMEKEKKAPKSRGFGFVQMHDYQQGLAAIAALNGKDFMGRALDVNPARPKAEARAIIELKKKGQPKVTVKAEQYPREERGQKKTWFKPVFNNHPALTDRRLRSSGQPGAYKGGKSTRSYTKRRGSSEMQEEAKPWQRSQDSPMRRGQREGYVKPWRKPAGDSKPWRKPVGDAKPWKKPTGDVKPWKRTTGDSRPWRKPAGDAKPWSKSSRRPNESRFKGR